MATMCIIPRIVVMSTHFVIFSRFYVFCIVFSCCFVYNLQLKRDSALALRLSLPEHGCNRSLMWKSRCYTSEWIIFCQGSKSTRKEIMKYAESARYASSERRMAGKTRRCSPSYCKDKHPVWGNWYRPFDIKESKSWAFRPWPEQSDSWAWFSWTWSLSAKRIKFIPCSAIRQSIFYAFAIQRPCRLQYS